MVILIVTGFALSSVYRQAVERSFDRRLNLYLRTLIAEVLREPAGPDGGLTRRRRARGLLSGLRHASSPSADSPSARIR